MTESTNAQLSAEAASWIEKRDRDEWSATNQAHLDAWLALSPAHRATYWRLEAAWKDTNRLTAFRHPQRPAERRNVVASFLKSVAALAIVAVCGSAVLTYVNTPEGKVYSTTIGGRQILTLGDGSKIDLNTDSAVRVAITEKSRKVWLDKGEAFFEVTHDSTRPFVVMVGDREVTDLGTKFQIKRETGKLRVAVLEGRVQIDEKNSGAKPMLLNAGDVATATGNTIKLVRLQTRDLEKDLGWQRGVLVFDNRTLADVIAEFNRYNTRKLVITDRMINATRIAGTFRSDNLDAFTNTLERVLHFKASRHGETIIISN